VKVYEKLASSVIKVPEKSVLQIKLLMQVNWYLQYRIISVVTTVRTHSIGIEKDYRLEVCIYIISFWVLSLRMA